MLTDRHQSPLRSLRLLAVLLLADGRWVSSAKLATISRLSDIPAAVTRLKQRHDATIETRASKSGGGYRLAGLPADCCLQDMLDVVHELRRETHLRVWRLAA